MDVVMPCALPLLLFYRDNNSLDVSYLDQLKPLY